MKARNDVIGIEATIPAKKVDLLAISEISKTKIAVIKIFKT